MHALMRFLLLAVPFWEGKSPREWTDEELLRILTDSPWAQTTEFRAGPPAPVYLATAKPVREAETEWLRRYSLKFSPPSRPDPTARNEYEQFLKENDGKVIVIGVRNPNLRALASANEVKHMEEESFLKVGGKKIRMTGHFPPAESDPVLRFIFPRPEVTPKELVFELYLPGVTAPYRQAVFRVRDMLYKGQVEY
jgi:hypothetical protein